MEEYPFFRNRIFASYKEFEEFNEFYKNKNLKNSSYFHYNLNLIETYMENKKKAIDSYRNTWGSEDNDEETKKYYQNIVEDEPSIHAEKLHLIEQQVTQ